MWFYKENAKIDEWVEGELMYATGGKADWPIPVGINSALVQGNYDLIINLGQFVPHEVLGFANHNKNFVIGFGGKSTMRFWHCTSTPLWGLSDASVGLRFMWPATTWILVLVLLASADGEELLESIMDDVGRTDREIGVSVVGGHTGVSVGQPKGMEYPWSKKGVVTSYTRLNLRRSCDGKRITAQLPRVRPRD